MEPAIKNGDTLIFSKVTKKSQIDIGNIVLCNHPFKKKFPIIKRVTKIQNGQFFLKGDNKLSHNSSDSRSFGFVSQSQIIGRL